MYWYKLLLILTTLTSSAAWNLCVASTKKAAGSTRLAFLQNMAVGTAAALTLQAAPSPAMAVTADTTIKLINLSNAQLKEIITKDILEKSFLATGQVSREVYDEGAKFTDEIDTYTLDKWIAGTQKLFVGDKSRVALVGDVDVNDKRVEFRFDEDLMFNIPFKPTVSLTGKVVLARDATTGLITSYQEFWDQDVATVLKSAKF
jgi:hypothetical protein